MYIESLSNRNHSGRIVYKQGGWLGSTCARTEKANARQTHMYGKNALYATAEPAHARKQSVKRKTEDNEKSPEAPIQANLEFYAKMRSILSSNAIEVK